MRVDLHLHSWISDGALAPAEIVRLAIRGGLDVIALTDHDTAAGIPEALDAAADSPIRILTGIEISARQGDRELHILGYGIDPMADSVVAHQQAAANRRLNRMVAMVEKLREMGVGVTLEDVRKAAGPSAQSLGRPHLARALFARRFTRYYNEAFDRYIGDSGPAYVAEGFPSPADAIAVIRGAGGKSVWAHPPLDTFASLLPELVHSGLDGIECFRPGVDRVGVTRIEAAAGQYGLFLTGGSDWHGPMHGTLGAFTVDADRVAEVLTTAGTAG